MTPIERHYLARERLTNHAGDVIERMERGIRQAPSKAELERRKARHLAYMLKTSAELAQIDQHIQNIISPPAPRQTRPRDRNNRDRRRA